MNLPPVDDEVLIQQYYECDDTAFDELCKRYEQHLYIRIKWILRRSDLAEDLAQDTLIKVMRTKDKTRSRFNSDRKAKFSTWINTIAMNTVRDFLRRRKPEVSFTELEHESEEGEFSSKEWSAYEFGESEIELIGKMDLERCMALLDEKERACVLLRLDKERFEDIAEIFQCSVPTAHRLAKRAFAKLRDCLLGRIRRDR